MQVEPDLLSDRRGLRALGPQPVSHLVELGMGDRDLEYRGDRGFGPVPTRCTYVYSQVRRDQLREGQRPAGKLWEMGLPKYLRGQNEGQELEGWGCSTVTGDW